MFLFLTFQNEADRDAFEYLYHKYKRLMFHKAFGILHNYTLTEDAVSEAFIRIYKNLHKINEPDAPQTVAYIMTIVKNAALTMLKQEQKWSYEEIPEDTADVRTPEAAVIDRLSEQAIIAKVEALNEELRSVFLLKYAYRLSHKEIAAQLGITENNVTVRLHRAKQKLGALLEKEGYQNG